MLTRLMTLLPILLVVLVLTGPAHARHHKKKPTATPTAKIANPVSSPDPAK